MADLPDKFDQYSSVHGQEDAVERLRRSEEKLRAYLDNISDTIWLIDANLIMAYVSSSVTRLLGVLPEELIGQPSALVIHPDDMAVVTGAQRYVMEHPGEPHTIQYRVSHKDGRWIHVESTGVNMLGNPAINGVLVTMRGINERMAGEERLRQSEANQRAILNNSPYLTWLKDTEGCYIKVNKAYADYARLKDVRQIVGKTDFDIWPKALAEKYRADDAEVMASRQQKHIEEPSLDGDREHWVETFKTPVIDESGNVLGTTGFARDITERKLAEAELRIAATAFETQEGMMITDAHSVILRVNHAFTEITGYTVEEAVGQTPRLLGSGRHDADFYAAMWESILRTGAWHGEIWNRRKNGEVYPEQLSITAVKGNTGETTHYVATLRDITERTQAEEQIRNLAFYDTLTQLPNRRMLNDRLGQAIATCKRSGLYGALMFLDLDNFKPLNDTYGHDVGDLLLVEVAQRLIRCVREVDTVARFGGDEFVVMLSGLDGDNAESAAQAGIVAEKIRTTLAESYLLKIQQEGKAEMTVEHHCTASIGVVVFNSEAGAEDIIKWADIAMYQAKEGGRNSVHFFEPESGSLPLF